MTNDSGEKNEIGIQFEEIISELKIAVCVGAKDPFVQPQMVELIGLLHQLNLLSLGSLVLPVPLRTDLYLAGLLFYSHF